MSRCCIYAVSGALAIYTLSLSRIKQSYAGLLDYWVQYLARTPGHYVRIPTLIGMAVSIGAGIRYQGFVSLSLIPNPNASHSKPQTPSTGGEPSLSSTKS